MTSENYCTMTLWTIFDKQIFSKRLIGEKKGVLISSLCTYPGGRQGGFVMSLSSIVGTFLLFSFRLMGIKVPRSQWWLQAHYRCCFACISLLSHKPIIYCLERISGYFPDVKSQRVVFSAPADDSPTCIHSLSLSHAHILGFELWHLFYVINSFN